MAFARFGERDADELILYSLTFSLRSSMRLSWRSLGVVLTRKQSVRAFKIVVNENDRGEGE